ncbi:MAG: Mov34/MPN/PAD-1 family protein [Candidatus Methylumidiphilus sp.]
MPANPIEIPRALVNQILHHAQSFPEREVCGLVGAKDGIPTSWHPVANAAASPQVRFQLDPKGQIEAMRRIRERGEELFAIVHSHPTAPAELSPADLAGAVYLDALYWVISLDTKGVLEMRGFRIAQDKSVEEIKLSLKNEFTPVIKL